MDDLIYFWADGTWCFRDELTEHLTFMSDDYDVTLACEFFNDNPGEQE